MRMPITRDVLDLQMMVEGYRSEAATLARELTAMTYRLMQAEETIKKQDLKIQRQYQVISQLEDELIEEGS